MSSAAGEPLRLSMTLPGSASLGAFQAGACSALAVMITRLRSAGREVHVDAIGGSSAGSIVAMLFAHCMMSDATPRRSWRAAGSTRSTSNSSARGTPGAPLAFDDLRDELLSFLDDEDQHPLHVHEPLASPIEIQVGLTSLFGYEIPTTTPSGTEPSLSFADWAVHRLTPDGSRAEIVEPEGASLIDAVLTSASHPLALLPRTLDRSADEDVLRDRGVDNISGDMRSWFTDGGLVESEPVGRIVRAARRNSGEAPGRRLHLVVDPRSSGPSGDSSWADADADKSWLDGLRRAISVVPTQALHDDVRRVCETNHRFSMLDDAVDWLAAETPSLDRGDLRRRLAEMADLDGKERGPPRDDHTTPLPPIRVRWRQRGHRRPRRRFHRRVRRLPRPTDPTERLPLGWKSASAWIEDGLGGRGIERRDVDAVIEALDSHPVASWDDPISDDDGVAQLSRRGRWQLTLLAVQFAAVGITSAVPSPPTFERWRNR